MDYRNLPPLLRRASVVEWLKAEGLKVSTIKDLFASKQIKPRQISKTYAHYERDQIARDILQKDKSEQKSVSGN